MAMVFRDTPENKSNKAENAWKKKCAVSQFCKQIVKK